MGPRGRCFILFFGLSIAACGGSEEPAPTPVEAAATPAAPPPPTGPATLHHVILDEWVAAPASPLRAPFAPPSAREGTSTDPAVLEADGADEALVAQVAAVLGGGVEAEADLALVEWTLTWGEDGIAGAHRAWGLCALPCTLEEKFAATSLHHPADPITSAGVHFAGRPHAADVVIERSGQVVQVRHGDTMLWAGAQDQVIDVADTWEVSPVDATGRPGRVAPLEVSRRLAVLDVVTTTIAPSGAPEPVPSTVRVLPEIVAAGQKPPLVPRAVEGAMELWPWASASRFEGTASVKPDPSRLGVRFVRQDSQAEWVPTARQAGEFEVQFPVFALSRNGVTLDSLQPFPDGARVFASVAALDGRLAVASRAGKAAEERAAEVVKLFTEWDGVVPLPALQWGGLDPAQASEAEVAAVRERSGPPIAVLVHDADVGTVLGGPGGAPATHVVSDRLEETESVARAFGRAHLGPAAGRRTEVTADWAASVVSRVQEREDPSLWARVFREAGDDVESAWLDHLRDPQHEGAPAVDGFLAFVGGQLPALAATLRRELALRTLAVRDLPALRDDLVEPAAAPSGDDDSGDDDDSAAATAVSISGDGAGPTVAAFRRPAAAGDWSLDLVPAPGAEPPHSDVDWEAALVSVEAWEAADDPAARLALLGLPATVESAGDDGATPAPTPDPAAPRALRAIEGEAVLVVLAWGADGFTRDLVLTPASGDSQ